MRAENRMNAEVAKVSMGQAHRTASDRSRSLRTASMRDAAASGERTDCRLRLTPGVRLVYARDGIRANVLVCAKGRAHLNAVAADILRLCDGSRSRSEIVNEIVRARANMCDTDVYDFLGAARACGWIVET